VTLRVKEHRCEISKARDIKIPAMLVLPCIQNVPGKNGELSPSGYSLMFPDSWFTWCAMAFALLLFVN